MELSQAIMHLSKVVEGVDPQTANILDGDHPLRREDIVSALDTILNSVPMRVARMVNEEPAHEFSSGWNDNNIRDMLEMFDDGASVEAIANHLHMPCVSIESRLRLAGRMPASGVHASLIN